MANTLIWACLNIVVPLILFGVSLYYTPPSKLGDYIPFIGLGVVIMTSFIVLIGRNIIRKNTVAFYSIPSSIIISIVSFSSSNIQELPPWILIGISIAVYALYVKLERRTPGNYAFSQPLKIFLLVVALSVFIGTLIAAQL